MVYLKKFTKTAVPDTQPAPSHFRHSSAWKDTKIKRSIYAGILAFNWLLINKFMHYRVGATKLNKNVLFAL